MDHHRRHGQLSGRRELEIIASSAVLTLWAASYHLTSTSISVISAFSSNAISAGIGALIGGWICDRYGRKRIYTWDLLLYVFRLLWIVFAAQPGCSYSATSSPGWPSASTCPPRGP